MLARSATIIKWVLYALAGLACTVVQAAVLQRFTLWGVIPFLYPLIAALPATFEGPAAGTLRPAAPLPHSLFLHADLSSGGTVRRTAVPEPHPGRVSLLRRGISAGLSSHRGVPLHRPLGHRPRRMDGGAVCHAAGAVRLPALEFAHGMAVPEGLPPCPH